jgi:hypothetical protein
VESSCRRLSSGERTLACSIEVLEGRIEWSKFSVENSRNSEDRRIQESCGEVKRWTNPSFER